MESIKSQNTGSLQRGLLIVAALVVTVMVAASAALLARHFTASGPDPPAPVIQNAGPAPGLGGDSKSGYGVDNIVPAPRVGGRPANHQ